MGGGISKMAKQELVGTIRYRYQKSSKKEKGGVLDEFTATTGHHGAPATPIEHTILGGSAHLAGYLDAGVRFVRFRRPG